MIDLNHIEFVLKGGSIGGSVCLIHEQAADLHSLLVEVVGGDNVDFHGLFADVISLDGQAMGLHPCCATSSSGTLLSSMSSQHSAIGCPHASMSKISPGMSWISSHIGLLR